MRPTGATLRLFAQWLRPTSNYAPLLFITLHCAGLRKKVVLGLVARHIVHVPAPFAITHRPRVRRAVHNPNGVAPQRLQRRRPVHALACVARTPAASAKGDCQRP
jgi:hypothetical protein